MRILFHLQSALLFASWCGCVYAWVRYPGVRSKLGADVVASKDDIWIQVDKDFRIVPNAPDLVTEKWESRVRRVNRLRRARTILWWVFVATWASIFLVPWLLNRTG